VGAKIMINENHFQFDRKSFFNFWKMIYGFKTLNHFSNLNSSFLPAGLWESATAEHWSLLVARVYRRRFQILAYDCRNLAALAGFW
jgi:hypothetical protein